MKWAVSCNGDWYWRRESVLKIFWEGLCVTVSNSVKSLRE
jgi:hypothetical protein